MSNNKEYLYAKRLQDDAIARGEEVSGKDHLDPVGWLKRYDATKSDAYLRGRSNIGKLRVYTAAELCARVDARGPRAWLLRGVWPAGDYGVLAADPKAQKTWTAYDMAISVASGVDWLGFIKVETTGPVLVFVGEGGEEETVRRMRAIAQAKGLRLEDLQIAIVTRVPHLGDQEHLDEMEALIHRLKPALVIVDPFYLAGRGANSSNVFDMGGLLEAPQHLCQAAKASLLVVHHNNRKAEAKGAQKISGAGPSEWGRVLITGTVKARRRDPVTWETTVVTELDIIGGGIAGGELRVTRRIRVDGPEPDDLNAPLWYHVAADWSDGSDDDDQAAAADPLAGLRPAARRVLAVLRAATHEMTVHQIGDEIAKAAVGTTDSPLKARTIQDALKSLRDAGLADKVDGHGFADVWLAIKADEDTENAA